MLRDLNVQHIHRSEASPAFTFLRQNSERIIANKKIKELSLNLKQRETTNTEIENRALLQLNQYRASLGLKPVTKDTRSDNPLPDEDEHWNIVFHKEAARILLSQIQWTDSAIAKKSKDEPSS